jgi:hypothetical protein
VDTLLENERKDAAFDLARRWLKARVALRNEHALLAPGGTFADNAGNFFFPPEALVQRCLESENSVIEKKERFVHPDLENGAAWTLACMLYRVFCGTNAFQATDTETLHQDMREGVFFPPRLMVPGIDQKLNDLITRAFSRFYEDHPPLEEWLGFIGSPDADDSKKIADYFHELTPAESEKLQQEKEKFTKKKDFSVKTKRYISKNNAIIFGIAAAIAIIGTITGSVIYDRSQLPNTKGMTPSEVVHAYYDAISTLDHVFMQEAVLKKAGKDDIDMVTSLFVLGKVRQAYQMNAPFSIIPAQEWLNAGSGDVPPDYIVFGVSDLRLLPEDTDESDGEVTFKVQYNLWAPAYNNEKNSEEDPETPRQSAAQSREDELRLVSRKGAWRIAEIKRP